MRDGDDNEEDDILLCVKLPDVGGRSQTRIRASKNQSIYSVKQDLLSKINAEELPNDALNYGLYLRPTGPGRSGKFLDDGRLLSEYEISSSSFIEFLYKKRDYTFWPNLTSKAITKANSKSNQKKLMDHVIHGSVKKLEKLLDTGLDPNFIYDDGNTPLGAGCGRNGKVGCIAPLVSRGAHIDFRGSGGLTPIHRAAIGGNVLAVKNLLALGSSPNYTDDKGMTPIYHAAIMGDDVGVTRALLEHKAIIGQTDSIGWTELHQIAKHGNSHLIDIMLLYGADIDAENDSGNTPLHVAAQHGQMDTALHLMKRGASRVQCNAAGQPPNQVAILCGHRLLSKEILSFTDRDQEPLKGQMSSKKPEKPAVPAVTKPLNSYHSKTLPSKGRKGDRSDFKPMDSQKWSQQLSPSPNYYLDIGSSQSQSDDDFEEIEPVHLSTGSSSAGSQQSSTPSPTSHKYSEKRRITMSTTNPTSTSHSSTMPRTRTPAPLPPRERLYACTPGKKYTVMNNVSPQRKGDLELVKGQAIEVLYIGKGDFWEGKIIGGGQGWFPKNAITPTTENISNNSTLKKPEHQQKTTIKPASPKSKEVTKPIEDVDPKSTKPPPERVKAVAAGDSRSKLITVHRTKGPDGGYGFAMRGVTTVSIETFQPNENVPSLQYVGEVTQGGAADTAGLKQGDFIIEVNGVDTTCATHKKVVSLINEGKGTIRMKIIPKPQKTQTENDKDATKTSTNRTKPSKVQNDSKSSKETTQELNAEVSQKTSVEKTLEKSKQSQNETRNDDKIEKKTTLPQTTSTTTTVNNNGGKISPKLNSSSRKGKTDSPSPLLHSISYKKKDNETQRGEIPSPTSSRTGYDIEGVKKKEKEDFEKHLKDTDDEEELSGFAKELRKASLSRQDRLSTKNNQTEPEQSTKAKTEIPKEVNKESKKNSSPAIVSAKETEGRKEKTPSATNNDYKELKPVVATENSKQDSDKLHSPVLKQMLPKKRSTGSELHVAAATATPSNKPSMNTAYEPITHKNGISTGGSHGDDSSSDEDDGWTEVEIEPQSSIGVKDFKSISGYDKDKKGTKGNNSSPAKPSSLEGHKQQSPNLPALRNKDDKTRRESPRLVPGSGSGLNDSTRGQQSRNKSTPSSDNKGTASGGRTKPSESKDAQKNDVKGASSQKPKSPPPVAKKPKPTPPPAVNQKPSTISKPRSDEEEHVDGESVSLPVTSLRNKFETMSKISSPKTTPKPNTKQPATTAPNTVSHQPESTTNKPVQKPDNVEPKNALKTTTLTPTVEQTSRTKNEDKDKGDIPPPPRVESDPILPPPLSISDDDDDDADDIMVDFLPPPPPVMPSDSDTDSDDSLPEPVAPPPPLYDDMDDDELFDNPPVMDDVPVPLTKLLNNDFEPHPPAQPTADPVDKPDLLQDIVGQLQNLTTNGLRKDEGSESECSDDVPPPLPSCPPPSEGLAEAPPTGQPHPPDYIPAPVDLPPPAPLDDSIEDDSMLLPPPDDLPAVLTDDEDLDPDNEYLPPPQTPPPEALLLPPQTPPPEALPPPLEPIDDDITDDGDTISLPPAPIIYDEQEDDILDDDDLLQPPPVPMDILPPPPPVEEKDLQDPVIDEDNQEQEIESRFDSKPLDSWDVDDVCQWLTEVGLDSHIPTFKENEIVGEHLRDLNREDLKDLGISKIGHIKTFKQKLEPYLLT